MTSIFKLRVIRVWLFLVLITCLSWEAVQGAGWVVNVRIGTSAVMIIAFLKARFILLDFMELRHAPLAMQIFAEAWVLLVASAIILMYWLRAAT